MGIVKGIFGTRISGKVGNVVFRTRGSTNVVSEKASTVKNPRSDAQQFQRMCMATCSAAYAGLKSICDHSFEGIVYGAASMSYFMKMNLPALRAGTNDDVWVAYNAKGNNVPYPNDLLISKGSLPSISYEVLPSTGRGVICGINISLYANNMPADITVAKFHEDLGIQIGDQITLIGMGLTNSVVSSDYVTQNGSTIGIARLIFKADAGASTLFTEENINQEALDLDKSSNYNIVGYDTGQKILVIKGTLGSISMVGAGIIISRKSGDTWKRSTQRLVPLLPRVSSSTTEMQNNYGRDAVLPSYLPTGEKYLNNANV